MDLHARRSVLLRMTPEGQRLGRVRIDNSPAALKAEVAKAGPHPKVVLEATYGWYWAADALAEAGAEVLLAHPLGVKMFTYRRVKTDDKDATARSPGVSPRRPKPKARGRSPLTRPASASGSTARSPARQSPPCSRMSSPKRSASHSLPVISGGWPRGRCWIASSSRC
ncbi:transposase [Streptomyces sp. NPDC048415]|uniref:IS110 family transposase n=1 Tax=Streptomyces sp. NPDC048415 TaxID=3154822 RepID=UPI003441F730